MRGDVDDRYNRRAGPGAIAMPARNGGPAFDVYGEQNSMYDFRDVKFELDHLATFAAGTRSGFIPPEEGLHKLRTMENSMGIWTMRCTLSIDRQCVVIQENGTGDELERFPLAHVQDPTAIFKNDRREIYNNLILFTVLEDPLKKKPAQADMHIFQSIKAPAQDIVDEILAAKNGQPRVHGVGSRIPPPPVVPAPEPPNGPYNFQGMRDYMENQYASENKTYGNNVQDGQFGPTRAFFSRISSLREKEDLEGKSTEVMERDVTLLNHCFDDIEKFVARLQQAAEAFKELERRKKDRGAKNKKRQGGDGMLAARAKPPPDRDFVDIFQKFKLSFNLLAKLRAHIHDPNAPELVHFLFTPLSLIYEASRDPLHGNKNLGDQAVAPVLTTEAKELLLNCLTTKEIELWQTLGKHWTTSVNEWHGHIPSYMPEFYDGWQPASVLADEMTSRSAMMSQPPVSMSGMMGQPPVSMAEPMRNPIVAEERISNPYNNHPIARPMPFPDEDPRMHMMDRFSQAVNNVSNNQNDFDRNSRELPPSRVVPEIHSRSDANTAYLDELMKMEDVLIYEATHDRTGKNPKELTVQKGDILQVMDNNRNWWKLRNYKGTTGFAPYTILTAVKGIGTGRNGEPLSARTASDYSASRRGASRRDSDDRQTNLQMREPSSYNEYRSRFRPPRDDSFDSPFYTSVRFDNQGQGQGQGQSPPKTGSSNLPSAGTRHNGEYRPSSREIPAAPQAYPQGPSSSRNRNSDPPEPRPRPTQSLTPPRRPSIATPPDYQGAPSAPDYYDDNDIPQDYHEYQGTRMRTNNPTPAKRNSNLYPSLRSRSDSSDTSLPFYANHDEVDVPKRSSVGSDGAWRRQRAPSHPEDSQIMDRGPHHVPRDNAMPRDVTRLDVNSSSHDVVSWLKRKGFSAGAQYAFRDYTGQDLFQSRVSEFMLVLSHEEAIRLDGLLRIQKGNSGYATQSTKELNRILQMRKDHLYTTQRDEIEAREVDALPRRRAPDMNEPEVMMRKEAERAGPAKREGRADFREQLVRQRSRLRQGQSD